MGSTLALHTAHGPMQVALAIPSERNGMSHLHRTDQGTSQGQDARLPALIDGLISDAGLSFSDLAKIAVVTGPGSFTGLRMGIAFARGLGLVIGCPVVGISLLEACLSTPTAGPIRIAIQAQKRPPDITFWCQDFSDGLATAPPVERSIEDAATTNNGLLTDRPDLFPNAAVTGHAAPSASAVARLALTREPSSAPPSPLYVRPPDAAPPKPGLRPAAGTVPKHSPQSNR